MVRTPAHAAKRHNVGMASDWRHRLLMGHRFLRVLLPGTRQPHRLRRQRRTIHTHTVKGNTGVCQPDGVRHYRQCAVSATVAAVEPPAGFRLVGGCGVAGFLEMMASTRTKHHATL